MGGCGVAGFKALGIDLRHPTKEIKVDINRWLTTPFVLRGEEPMVRN